MKQILLNKKLNNKGSSLMFVLIAIAFVSILTAVIISAATTNYRLKVMNNRTQKTFYSAEIALEEVYAGFGKTSCDVLEEEYLKIAKELTTQVLIDKDYYAVNIDNKKANEDLKKQFFESMYDKVAGVGVDLDSVLSDYLTDPSGASVIAHGAIEPANKVDIKDRLVIHDVVISYKEGNYEYYSTVAVDIEITYPAEEIDFISNTKSNLQTFLEYCIIAMDGVKVGDGAGKDSNGTISGGLYAGGGGIVVDSNSSLTLGEDNDNVSLVATPGNLTVHGKLDFINGDLWCKNIEIGSDAIHNVVANFNSDTRLFVADDLNMQGNYCSVTLGSEYIGYGYHGTVHNASSSAIIINGRNSSLSATNLSKFVIAGRAYIDFESTKATDYMTADSLGIKGIQKVYLVPLYYMNQKEGYTLDVTNPTTDINSVVVNLDGFFAKELLKDGVNAYTVKTVGDVNYFYLNFKDEASQREYVKCILNEDYFKKTIKNKGDNSDRDRDLLRGYITDSMDQFIISGVIDVDFNADAKFYTAGNLYEVYGGTMGSIENSAEISDVSMWCLDKDHRFTILNSFLYDVGRTSDSDTTYVAMPDTFNIAGHTYSTTNVQNITAYERILDIPELEKTKENYIDERTDGYVSAVIVKGTYTVPDYITGGVIVAYNQNVIVKNSFEGLIITNGTVTTITDTGELITDGVRDVASRILDEDLNLSKYFYAYQMDTSEPSYTSNVGIEDVLSFTNWRKNYAE